MSSISSIGGFGVDPDQFNVRTTGLEGSRPPIPSGEVPQRDGGRQNPMMERIESLAVEAGLDSETIATMQEELQAAISSALENAHKTGESGDPRQAVHAAVQRVLEKYGIDTRELTPGQGRAGPDALMARIESLAADAGLDSETTASLLEELQSAVSSALENARNSGESGDPRQAVHAAVQSTLGKYGIDADQLKPPSGGPGFSGGGRPQAAGAGGNLGTESEGQGLFAGLSTDANQGVLQSLLDLLQIVDEEA